jgi:arylsulfatase A
LGEKTDAPSHFGFDQSCLWQLKRGNSHTINGKKYDSRHTSPDLSINGVAKEFRNGEFGPDVCVDFIERFMEQNKDEAFFVYYPMILPHCPFIPTPGTPDYDPSSPGSPTYKGDAKYFKNMVEHVDQLVGRIVSKVDELGLSENTLIVFTGDNGTDVPVVTSLNGKPIAGGKGKAGHDSGVRTPFVVTMPGTVQAEKVSDELVDFSDLLPTFCELAGVDTSDDKNIDGVSLMPTLTGVGERKKPWSYLFYSRNDATRSASSVVVRNATRLVLRKGGPGKKVQLFDCSVPYARKVIEEGERTEGDRKVYAELAGVMEKYDVRYQSDLSEVAIAEWQKKTQGGKKKKK